MRYSMKLDTIIHHHSHVCEFHHLVEIWTNKKKPLTCLKGDWLDIKMRVRINCQNSTKGSQLKESESFFIKPNPICLTKNVTNQSFARLSLQAGICTFVLRTTLHGRRGPVPFCRFQVSCGRISVFMNVQWFCLIPYYGCPFHIDFP